MPEQIPDLDNPSASNPEAEPRPRGAELRPNFGRTTRAPRSI